MSEETWVLLRGLVREQRHWEGFDARVRERFGVRVLTPDTPGNGVRHREPSPLSVGGMLDVVRDEVRAQGVTGKVFVLAQSLGGMITIEWLRRHPEELHGAVLVNTSLRGISPSHHRFRPANLPALAQRYLLDRKVVGTERLLLELTLAVREDRDALASRWAAFAEDQPVSFANTLRQMAAAARFRAPAEPPPGKVLVVCGARDRLVEPACSLALAGRWGAPIEVHSRGGHDLCVDDPEWMLERLARFRSSIAV
jgi:pimeloyl-ACP methyl ester carboxylesterase